MPEQLTVKSLKPTAADQDESAKTTQTPVDETLAMDNNTGLEDMQKKQKTMMVFAVVAGVMLLLGAGTGYGVYQAVGVDKSADDGVLSTGESIEKVAGDQVSVGDIFGTADEESFKDLAQGYLEAGGVNAAGTHKLLREGGPTQTVALTSSITDLSKLEGMEVKIWGDTQRSEETGWFMDVGRVEVLDTQGEPPEEF